MGQGGITMSDIILVQPPDPPNTQILRDHMGMFGILKKGISLIKNDVLPPLNLAYSASLLEKNGFDVNIIDASAMGYDYEKTLKEIKKENPKLTIINISAVSNDFDLNFSERIKEFVDSKVAVSGPHLALMPEIALKRKNIDFVVFGDIEYPVLGLSKNMDDLKRIKGIAYKKRNKIVKSPKTFFTTNLDELPFPAYHLLPMKKYCYNILEKHPFTTILTSRGCPYSCIYCPYPLGYGNFWRGRSVENVLEEMKLLKEKFKIKSLLFRDQVATFDMKRAEKIYDGMIREKFDFEWRCETRVDKISKTLMEKMKESGCVGLHFGVESGDPVILKKVGKVGNISLSLIKKRFKEAKDTGLSTVAYFMIGLPGETKHSIEKTFKLVEELKADYNWFTVPVPYPGTKLHEIAKRESWILTEDWSRYSGREVVMKTDELSKEEIERMLEEAKLRYSKESQNLFKLFVNFRSMKIALKNPRSVIKYTVKKVWG
jgi:radical SAM superfamily enzyme YgiQ (UPF0313 family)